MKGANYLTSYIFGSPLQRERERFGRSTRAMHGGAGKSRGRGSGAGNVNRMLQIRRPAGGLSGGPRNHPATSSTAVTSADVAEESFGLVAGNNLNFGMIIRLVPGLVDEIKRAEEHGSGARIKFDTCANNTSGNVIDVGGKTFRFTWSREVEDLCDIYEECQSDKNGDGMLVESGCAWRKLNVQRVLDESTKNHVKKLSEEAERQQKSRKAIILDHGNPSMKNQMEALAAAETTPWRKSFNQKKEPELKKRKINTPPVAIVDPAKSVSKSGLPSTTTVLGKPSFSPSPPQYSGAPTSPFVAGSMTKGHMRAEDFRSNQAMMKDNDISLEKEKFKKPTSNTVHEKRGRKGNFTANSMDLQSMLITLLKGNPKGMSLKALEKAVGDSVPNSRKKIELIIKKIATYQAPGRYILKQEVELGSSNKPFLKSGSSPDGNGQRTPVVEKKHEDTATPTPNFAQKTSTMELEKTVVLNLNLGKGMESFDNVSNLRHSPDLSGEKKLSDNSEGPARRSSASDSDVSFNSKQGPDEDVDIMTSDDYGSKPKTQISELNFSTSPIASSAFNVGPVQNGLENKQYANGFDIVGIEHDVPDDVHGTQIAVVDPDKNSHTEHMFSERADRAEVGCRKSGEEIAKHIYNEGRENEDSGIESSKGGVKRRESCADENSCFFSKYDKEEPELKGPIKDISQYKEYVQEYQEKYASYCSLKKALESYRDEFYELGKDLENAKGRDMEKYYQIVGQLHESYRQYGTRHKRLKKIFIVLHEELEPLKQEIQDFAASYARG